MAVSEGDLTFAELKRRHLSRAERTLVTAFELQQALEQQWLKEHPLGVDENGLTAVFMVKDGEIFRALVSPEEREQAIKEAQGEMFDVLDGKQDQSAKQ
jgi:hypothetical protein